MRFHRSTLQAFNGLLFVAQILAAVACLVVLVAGTHEMRASDTFLRFYWNRSEAPLGGSTSYRSVEHNHTADQCYAGGIVLLLFCITSFLILLFNISVGVIRVMEIPDDWLSQYMNVDLDRWLKREALRVSVALLLFGLALVVWGATCVRSSAAEFGAATPLHTEGASLVLTGYLYALISWILLLFALALYGPLWVQREEYHRGEGSAHHSRETHGHYHYEEDGTTSRRPAVGLAGTNGARRSSIDGGTEEGNDSFTHPDAVVPHVDTEDGVRGGGVPKALTVGQLSRSAGSSPNPSAAGAGVAAVISPREAERRRQLNLDHVLKINNNGSDHASGPLQQQQQQHQNPHHGSTAPSAPFEDAGQAFHLADVNLASPPIRPSAAAAVVGTGAGVDESAEVPPPVPPRPY